MGHIHRFDLEDLAKDPLRSGADTGGARGFAYSPDLDEIYIFHLDTENLLYLDASTLSLKEGSFCRNSRMVIRGFVLSGSLVTGEIELSELRTGRRLGRFHLGPWLRTIQLGSTRSVAYVSSTQALYEVNYGELL